MNVFKIFQILPLLIEAITQLISAIKKLSDAVDTHTLVTTISPETPKS